MIDDTDGLHWPEGVLHASQYELLNGTSTLTSPINVALTGAPAGVVGPSASVMLTSYFCAPGAGNYVKVRYI